MAAESDVQDEIEVLESIYLDELKVQRGEDGQWEVSLVLFPSTAEESDSQFVRLTLKLTLDQQYPSSSPSISIHNPRGLSDDKLTSVTKCLQLEAESCLGSPVLYQLIEKAKEILTESNIPHGSCVICLFDFKEGEAFTKTSCYHYFHCHCLGRYVRHSEREIKQRERELEEDKTRDHTQSQDLSVVCPVCREPLSYDVDQLLSAPAPLLPEIDEVSIRSDFRLRWKKLQKVLDRQKSRGGIIDPEQEANRFLIHINEPTPAEDPNQEVASAPSAPNANANANVSTSDDIRAERFAPERNTRGVQGHRRHNQARGQRRGNRFRPNHQNHQQHQHHHGRNAAFTPNVTEHLDKLSLSSSSEEKQKEKASTFKNQEQERETKRVLREDQKEKECQEPTTERHQTENPTSNPKFDPEQSSIDPTFALKDATENVTDTAEKNPTYDLTQTPNDHANDKTDNSSTYPTDAPRFGRERSERSLEYTAEDAKLDPERVLKDATFTPREAAYGRGYRGRRRGNFSAPGHFNFDQPRPPRSRGGRPYNHHHNNNNNMHGNRGDSHSNSRRSYQPNKMADREEVL